MPTTPPSHPHPSEPPLPRHRTVTRVHTGLQSECHTLATASLPTCESVVGGDSDRGDSRSSALSNPPAPHPSPQLPNSRLYERHPLALLGKLQENATSELTRKARDAVSVTAVSNVSSPDSTPAVGDTQLPITIRGCGPSVHGRVAPWVSTCLE